MSYCYVFEDVGGSTFKARTRMRIGYASAIED